MQGEEQLGPYSGQQLVEYATGGNITRESLVWTEGMAEWLPAGQIDGVFPAEAQPAVAAVQPGQVSFGGAAPAQGANPYATPGMMQQPALGADDPYPSPGVKASSFGLWLGLFLGSIVLTIVGFVMAGSAAASAAKAAEASGEAAELSTAQAGTMGIGAILILIGYVLIILSFIPMYINLYRSWRCLQPGGLARSTPGKAVGFLFIPFFNYYWIFMAFNGLAKDWNRTVATYSDLRSAPKLSEGVFLTFCIGCFLPPLGPIMLFPVMAQMCKGINFFAFRPKPGQGGLAGASTGGLNIGGGFTVR